MTRVIFPYFKLSPDLGHVLLDIGLLLFQILPRYEFHQIMVQRRPKNALRSLWSYIAYHGTIHIRYETHAAVSESGSDAPRNGRGHKTFEDVHNVRRLQIHFFQLIRPLDEFLFDPKYSQVEHL
jgi:hypothetical protein